MTCPRPNSHDPNPTAVPIKEAIKEIFKVFTVHPQALDTIKTQDSFHADLAILAPSDLQRKQVAAKEMVTES